MGKNVYYITQYPLFLDGQQVRAGQMSAKNKCDYIINTLNEVGYKVFIVSDSIYVGHKCYDCGGEEEINPDIRLKYFWCLGSEWGILRKLKDKLCIIQLMIFLLFKITCGENVVLYHSCDYVRFINIIQKIKKFNLILEIEDIYYKVWDVKKSIIRAEKAVLNQPYKAIVVSEIMKKLLAKPKAIVSYGSYATYNGVINRGVNEDKIIIVCTGLFDAKRGTGMLAVDTIDFLPDNYVLYLSGKIQDDSLEIITEKIREVNYRAGFEKCKFLGLLGEKEYEDLLLKANIGLNTQKEGDYSSYIFPSKIIKYLSYNLDVVTTPGDSIVNSCLKECFHITTSFDPSDIAEQILKIKLNRRNDYRIVLNKMHIEFKKNLVELLEQ